MAATVFYTESLPDPGAVAVLDGPEGHHAATVRRFCAGDRLLLSDTRGGVAQCAVTGVGRDRLEVLCERREHVAAPTPSVTVVQALPKSDRADLAVDLATEAGADRIVPWQAARCVSRWKSSDKMRKGLAKWAGTARSAAKQARRPRVPTVEPAHDTAALTRLVFETVETGGLALVLHESATGTLPFDALAGAGEVLLIVGPEGGVDDAELDSLASAGARAARLGPEVLRTSAAAAAALAAIGAVTGRWDTAPPQYGDVEYGAETAAQGGRLGAAGESPRPAHRTFATGKQGASTQ